MNLCNHYYYGLLLLSLTHRTTRGQEKEKKQTILQNDIHPSYDPFNSEYPFYFSVLKQLPRFVTTISKSGVSFYHVHTHQFKLLPRSHS